MKQQLLVVSTATPKKIDGQFLTKFLLTSSITLLSGYLGYRLFCKYKSILKQRDQELEIRNIVLKCHKKRNKSELDEIERRLDAFKLDIPILKQIMCIFSNELEKGLNATTNPISDLKMYPTYVYELPSGKETGQILALDLGGSNFRVVLIRLQANSKAEMENKAFILSESLMKGTGQRLFDHIALCLSQFMKCQNLDLNRTYSLGFTFSFPCFQTGLSKAVLKRWTKCFNCSETIDQDIVKLLQNAINKRGDIKVNVIALINDTVGTLMSCAYTDKHTAVGLILGTGTNACYFEKIDKIGTMSELDANNNYVYSNSTEMLINTEWGAFGEAGCVDFIRTKYDEEIDKTSINIGMQIFEKMISGMYLGEIVRLIILDLIEDDLIFREEMKLVRYRHALFTKGSFYAKYLNEIESDTVKYKNTRRIMHELAGIVDANFNDYAVVKYVCQLVTSRAAKLSAAGLAVLLNRMNKKKVSVAVDGSLFRYHPFLQMELESVLRDLLDPTIKFKIVLSQDGSGRGAAVVAAMAADKKNNF